MSYENSYYSHSFFKELCYVILWWGLTVGCKQLLNCLLHWPHRDSLPQIGEDIGKGEKKSDDDVRLTARITLRSRVTRLGEFSPFGQFFTIVNYVQNWRSIPNLGLLFSTVKVMHQFWQKSGLSTILGDFLQNHLVTLLRCNRTKWKKILLAEFK
jgi:hypothetical protein